MYKLGFLFKFLLFSSLAMTAQNNNTFALRATVEHGTIEGNYDTKTGIQKYFGIPFAKPPVGILRWNIPTF